MSDDKRYKAPVASMQTEEEVSALMRVLSHRVREILPAGVGFTLLVFDFARGGGLAYVSNARRVDMIQAMQEFIDTNAGGTLDEQK